MIREVGGASSSYPLRSSKRDEFFDLTALETSPVESPAQAATLYGIFSFGRGLGNVLGAPVSLVSIDQARRVGQVQP